MARVVFNADEIDQEFQFEDAIRRTLQTDRVASVRLTVIESSYDLEDEKGIAVAGSVRDKCQQIADRLNYDFSLKDDIAIFRRRP